MDNNVMQTEIIESTAAAEVTTDSEVDVFDSGWDGDGSPTDDDMELEMDEVTEEAAEADQQTAEETEDASSSETAEQTGEKKETADQRFTLKHLDEVKEVNRDEVIALAQKGMDYDRKTGVLNERIADYEEFLKELCPEGVSIEDMMDLTRARLLRAKEAKANRTISESDALLQVQKARAEKKAAAKAAAKTEAEKAEAERQQKSAESIKRFVDVYGNIDPKDIPQAVWDEAQKDGDLLGAYTRHENKKLKAELEAIKQTEKNKARSTGSRKTQGAAAAKDPFDAAWDAL